MPLLSLVTLTWCCLFGLSHQCVDISGIGDDESDFFTESELAGIPTGTLVLSFLTLGTGITNTETAVFSRIAVLDAIKFYNTLSPYEETALEFFAREDVTETRRRCQNNHTDLFELHRSVTLSYTMYFLLYYRTLTTSIDSTNAFERYTDILENTYGLDPDICFTNYNNTCNDISTPWGLAYQVVTEMEAFGINDGWNAFGSYNRDYNKIPYSDFRDDDNGRYIPKNSPWYLSDKYIDRWQPLLESDELGFLYYQEHNVPHIGFTGKSFFYDNDEFCQRVSNAPNYDYNKEMNLAINRLANLDEKMKMEIELWDDKVNLNIMMGRYQRARGFTLDSFEYIKTYVIDLVVVYESIIAVWKEKIRFDKVRPPSIIHKLLKDQLITSYAGVSRDGETFGTQTFAANDWEPYIRTMPHAEYPSASACICEAFAESMIEYFGEDNFTSVTGSDGIGFDFEAFSSEYEPLSTPSDDLSIRYHSWSEVSQRCGDSRLEGGMHFTESVPAGRQLCKDIGSRVTQSINALVSGNIPQFIIPFDVSEESVVQRDCFPGNNKDSSSSSKDSRKDSSENSSEDSSGW